MAQQLVAGGMAECVLALGFEKMQKGSLSSTVTTMNETDEQDIKKLDIRTFKFQAFFISFMSYRTILGTAPRMKIEEG